MDCNKSNNNNGSYSLGFAYELGNLLTWFCLLKGCPFNGIVITAMSDKNITNNVEHCNYVFQDYKQSVLHKSSPVTPYPHLSLGGHGHGLEDGPAHMVIDSLCHHILLCGSTLHKS